MKISWQWSIGLFMATAGAGGAVGGAVVHGAYAAAALAGVAIIGTLLMIVGKGKDILASMDAVQDLYRGH